MLVAHNRKPTDCCPKRQKEYTMHLSDEQILSRAGPSKSVFVNTHDMKPASSSCHPSAPNASMSKPKVSSKLFHQWRPTSHILAPQGWMNDPCGPSYDSRTGFYHLWYQWNPKGSTWGNMSWGHAISVDMVHWKSSTTAVIEPGSNHDHEGVFTGCVLHRSPLGLPHEATQDGQMTAIYTAVSKLPIHHTLPYNYGSEKVVLSTSSDGGKSWLPQGLVLPGPPENENVTAWRDPYIAEWPLMDILLAKKQPGLYALIAGGLRDETPTIFAYSVDLTDLSAWTYIGPLCDVGINQKAAPYGVDLGKNWEVANFFSLKDETTAKEEDFLLINVEGCNEPGPARASVCMKLDVQSTTIGKRGICLQPATVSLLDHGCLYAASSFHDQARDRRIMWGWITEDDLPESYYDQQGWSGMLSLPRELFAHPTSQDVGIRPAEEVAFLREGAEHQRLCLEVLSRLPARKQIAITNGTKVDAIRVPGVQTRSLEVQMNLDEQVRGLVIAHSSDLSTRTVLYLDSSTGQIVIDRTQSAGKESVIAKGIKVNTSTLRAIIPAQSAVTNSHTLRLFVDNSVLEVFVGDLVAISTRIYPDESDSGLSLLFAPDSVSSEQRSVDIWQGLSRAHLGFLS